MVAFPRAVIVSCNLIHCFSTFLLTLPSSLLKLSIKPHLESFHLFPHHPKSDLQKIVNTNTVKVVPVALTSDGTALKPGLKFDQRNS